MNKKPSNLGTGAWFLSFLVILSFALAAMIARSLLDVSRNDIAYGIQKAQKDAAAARAHIAKLEVERDSLLSPYALGKTAERLGMSKADLGQIRRIEAYGKK